MLHAPPCVTYGISTPPVEHEFDGVVMDVPLPVAPAGVMVDTCPSTRCTDIALYCTAPDVQSICTDTLVPPAMAAVVFPLHTHCESDGLDCVPVETHDMLTPPADTVAVTPVVPDARDTPATIALPTGMPPVGAAAEQEMVLLLVVLVAPQCQALVSAAEAIPGAHQVTRMRHDQDSAHVQ
jgi:hypothetical protein